MIEATPLELSAANEFVATLHRHHDPVHRDKFRIGASQDGRLVGVVQVGRPVSRMLDDGKTVEVVKVYRIPKEEIDRLIDKQRKEDGKNG